MSEEKDDRKFLLSVCGGCISAMLMPISLWCLWRSVLYGRPENWLKYALVGIGLDFLAILTIKRSSKLWSKRSRWLAAIPAYVLMVLLVGNLSLKTLCEVRIRYYGNLYGAVTTGDARLVKRRIEEGYDVNAKHLGKPIMHFAFMWFAPRCSRYEPYPPREVMEEKMVEMLEVLIDNGADINAVDEYPGRSTLFYAVLDRWEQVVRLLVDKGADVNLADNDGETPLHYARTTGIARTLIAGGANVSAKTENGDTPLHYAYRILIAEIFIQSGADVNAKNNEGKTPLDIAISDENEELAEFLQQRGAKRGQPP